MSKASNFRKRLLVTEGDLKQLWFEVQQVRNAEKREAFTASFKKLLKEANAVKITVVQKGGNNE